MEPASSPELLKFHSSQEISNLENTRHIVDDWLASTYTPSSQAIPLVHRNLLSKIEGYQLKGLHRHEPGTYRNIDIPSDPDEPINVFCRGTDIAPVMREYTRDLDRVLEKQHSRRLDENTPPSPIGNVEETIHDAAWAYYAFIRIHPFLDGNGRTGRFILSRVVQGGGMEGVFFGGDWYVSGARAKHLEAMRAVDRTGDLTHLELYLLDSVRRIYANKEGTGENQKIVEEIDSVEEKKKANLSASEDNRALGDIWEPFRNIDIAERISGVEKKAA